ncbi:MAG TPA: hypothetical protein VFA21_03380 [Pyrinomonadaceae bacterium]|nr:hypothetical protein [Pyrinomonadaceae bacterium]
MKKLGFATVLVLSLVFGAGSVFAQNANSGGTSANTGTTHHGRRHHRRHHRRHRRHHRRSKTTGNTNS